VSAIVVYESHWGNTAEVARAIAEGLGPEARALSTAEAAPDTLAGIDLLVAGAPVVAFGLPTEKIRENLRSNPGKAPAPPDLSHPALRSWLEALPAGSARYAAFETRVRGPFGHATAAIAERLERAGYRQVAEPVGFVVKGKYGPLRDGESERARSWGAELAAKGA
jgi:flavodoxin